MNKYQIAGAGLFFALFISLSGCDFVADVFDDDNSTGSLVITEVGSSFDGNEETFGHYIVGSRWIEVYNFTSYTAQLSDFKLRTGSSLWYSSTYQGIRTFNLPNLTVQPGSYVIIRGKTTNYQVNGPNIVYTSLASYVPFWNTNGVVELLKDGSTVDFVRFGSDSTVPTDTNQWAGGDAVSLPYTVSNFGYSIARNGSNTDTDNLSDWTLRAFSTPGGPNDVTSGIDADADGIPDSSEQAGSTFAGLPLYNWGARTSQKDIFIHIDYMDTNDYGVIPRKEALDKVASVFSSHGYTLHFDVGDLYGTGNANWNLDGQSHKVPYNRLIAIDNVSGYGNFYQYKSLYFPNAKKQIFYYVLFANAQSTIPKFQFSGIAELPGNDVIISLGEWGLSTNTTANKNRLINYQAGTLMHEFGHNLGLYHGGGEDIGFKPNYYSVMNYLYQLEGLPVIGSQSEGDRYYYFGKYVLEDSAFNIYLPSGAQSLSNGPYSSPNDCKIDYSSFNGSSINEYNINETLGLRQPGSIGVDYNGNANKTDTGLIKDLNGDGITNATAYSDYDDWSNIRLFHRTIFGDQQSPSRNLTTESSLNGNMNNINDDQGYWIKETLTRIQN